MAESFHATVEPITEELLAEMTGASWQPDPRCPRPADLALVRMNHWGFDQRVHPGELVIAAVLTDEVIEVFGRIFAARFPIGRMTRIDVFGGDDGASMDANNCSAFNFRTIAGSDTLSNHSFGEAIDINPVQNPWVRGETVLPVEGKDFLDRSDVRPGMIVRPGPVTDAFDAIGWDWGGDWNEGYKDYHHFARYRKRP